MSPEKVQLLLAQLDKVRIAAEDAAKLCGMPERLLAPFFMRPMPAGDWILELAKTQPRNPGLVQFMTDHMPEMPPARLQGAKHDGPNKVKKGERGKKAA
jgi:hypothetical protein